jgi:hypothetical protein
MCDEQINFLTINTFSVFRGCGTFKRRIRVAIKRQTLMEIFSLGKISFGE